ncbi:MAG: FAD-dependent oxidoreductase [Treponema sp.]|nr:FAD-dependent oxidoreductase [Treponema sp.]
MQFFSGLKKRLAKKFFGKVYAQLFDDCLYLTGELDNWDDIIHAGLMSVNKKNYTVVNNIVYKDKPEDALRESNLPDYLYRKWSRTDRPGLSSNLLQNEHPDVLVIGGGIIGCAIARELKKYNIDVILLEMKHDIAANASWRNEGIILPGLDFDNKLLRKRYVDIGYGMYQSICDELDVPFRNSGQYLCFTNENMKPLALFSMFYWKQKGIPVEYINKKNIEKTSPNLSERIKFALYFPSAGIVSPYDLTAAYAENAACNHVNICLNTSINDITVCKNKIESVFTNHGRIFPKLVINAAGFFAEEIAYLANDRFFSIYPYNVNNMIIDKKEVFLFNSISSQNASAEMPRVCAASYENDFIVSFGKFTENIIHTAGIQSSELIAAPAIAADAAKMAANYLNAGVNKNFNPTSKILFRDADKHWLNIPSRFSGYPSALNLASGIW